MALLCQSRSWQPLYCSPSEITACVLSRTSVLLSPVLPERCLSVGCIVSYQHGPPIQVGEREIQDCWGSSFSLQKGFEYILPFARVQWGLMQPFWSLWRPGVRSRLLLCRSFSSIYRCDAAAPPSLEAAFISWTVTSSLASLSHCFNLFCSTVHAARSKQAVLHISLYACYLSKQWSQQVSGAGGCSSTACCFVCLGCLCELCAIIVSCAREFPSWVYSGTIVMNILKAGKCGFLVCQTSLCISVPHHLSVSFPDCSQSHLALQNKAKHKGWVVSSFWNCSVSGTVYLEPNLCSLFCFWAIEHTCK